jgi:nucleotide-binding universal stress UspA family protein
MNNQHFFRNILVPVDGSRSCFHAQMLASLIASRFKSKVTVVHCISHECMHPELKAQYRLPPSILRKIEEVYLELGKKVIRNAEELFRGAGIEVDARLITFEDPAEFILQLVKNEGYDLVIIGNRAGYQSERYALGSVTAKVARHAECTVFIVKKKTLLEKILVAVDGSKHADRALEYSVQLAKKFRVDLALLHVEDDDLIRFGGPQVLDCIGTVGECILENASNKIRGVAFGKFLKYGNPAETIIKMAQKGNIDLIVVGSRGLSSVKRFLLGSVSDDISMHARSSVLIVR